MRSTLPTAAAASFALLVLTAPAMAQARSLESDADWLANCRNGWSGDRDRGRACEVRVVPVHLAGRSIEVDGGQNGGIRAEGWDGDSVRVSARLQANGDDDADARAMLAAVRVLSDDHRVRAEGPSVERHDRGGWSVSYLIRVPRRFDLDLAAHNGGIGVAGVSGKMDLRTTNGGMRLSDVGGDVHARTQNGSLHVELTGDRWSGAGLDAETQNGGVRLLLPEKYAALLETGTVNGRINTEIPITVRGRFSRRLSVPLNGGGPTVRALTTNGSVDISSR